MIVDEAHRTQYKSLAENMRAGLPNAQFLAFTVRHFWEEIGRQMSGLEIMFQNIILLSLQMMEQRFPYTTRRVPEMHNQNEELSGSFMRSWRMRTWMMPSRKSWSVSLHLKWVIKEIRLDEIAMDIVNHFPRRGYLGKGMVITLDKFTAVKMYDKVQRLWSEEIKKLEEK